MTMLRDLLGWLAATLRPQPTPVLASVPAISSGFAHSRQSDPLRRHRRRLRTILSVSPQSHSRIDHDR
jgi:hypothetical protein